MEETDNEIAIEPFRPNPLKAAFYSMIFPGLGQIYNGDTAKGSYYFVLGFILVVSAHLAIPILIYIVFLFYNMHDAYKCAIEKRKIENGG
ncbi:DUF5683 domain-containing protein [Methanolobus sp. ZRKC3]|uniref:DUF5683 domain-containing protein n=1 Tax=Methanolobus sp. ZRKC3 TaxID=3125786 RepID=UPI0032511E32